VEEVRIHGCWGSKPPVPLKGRFRFDQHYELKSSLIGDVHYPPLAGEVDRFKENFKLGVDKKDE
jgi:hypothetical protein